MKPASTLSDLSTRVRSNGFAFVHDFRSNNLEQDSFDAIGQLDHLPGLSLIQALKPTHLSDSTPNTYSGNFGYGAFPFHSDMAHWPTPPRFLALRCIKGTTDVKTRLLDSSVLAEDLGTSRLKRTLVKPRRPLEMSYPLMRLMEQKRYGEHLFRWDSIFMHAASPQSVIVCNEVEEWLATHKPIEVALTQAGDTLVIDNWRMLHARSPVPKGGAHRIIHRAYLSNLK
jgi:alpha-ketoglutarate-dependent taurine dioxygenase